MHNTATMERSTLATAGVTAAMWGLSGIFVRLLPPLSPFAVTSGRLLIAFAATLPMLAIYGAYRRDLQRALTRPIAYALAGLLVSYYVLATASFQLAPVAEVALLLSTPPLFVLALRRVQGDVPTRLESIGAIVSAAGIALILAPRLTVLEGFAKAHLVGDALAMCAAAQTALYAFLYRQLANHDMAPEPTSVTLLTFALRAAVLISIVWLGSIPVSLDHFRGRSLLAFLGLGVLCTAIPSFGFAIVSKRLPSIVTAAISLLIPLFAGLFAYVCLGEQFSSTIMPGSLLVLTGIVMILRQNHHAQAGPTSRSTGPRSRWRGPSAG
jgi:drug/metabolite transporter (DMT)-like permease